MFINYLESFDTEKTVNVFNTSDHMFSAVDIYIYSIDFSLMDEILTPKEDGTSKFNLIIDNIIFPLKYGNVGESPLNPIVYVKDESICKYLISDPTQTSKTTYIVGPSSNLVDAKEWEQSTNISNNDLITLKVDLVGSKYYGALYGYGIDMYGYNANNIIGYGGVDKKSILTELNIVIEESQIYKKSELYRERTNGFDNRRITVGI